MCHPWLAAGVVCFIGAQLWRELAPVLRAPEFISQAPGTGFLGSSLRLWFRRRLEPLVDTLLDAGITADWVTALQLAASVVCGIAYGAGWIFTAGWVLIGSGTLDVVDGAIARKGGEAGPRGAFIDSVVDRYGEFAVFAGLAAYFQDGSALWVVFAAALGAFMVSYTRARAEGLHVECNIGLMQRPERYVMLGGGSIIGSVAAHLTCSSATHSSVLLGAVVVVAVLANLTALQRIVFALRQLG